MMKTVRDILKAKAIQGTYTVSPETKVVDALRLMAEEHVGALIVVEHNRVVGLVSERDYARKVVLMARSSHVATVRDIMTTTVLAVDPDQTLEDCMQIMTERRFRHLPVIDEGRLIGLVSIGDVVKEIITVQQGTIHHLERYIRGETANVY